MVPALDQVESLDPHITELSHPGAAGEPTDLPMLEGILDDDPIVGLGESTHGTSEFVSLRYGITRFLVETCGIRLVALEVNFAEAIALDRYVREDEGSAERALAAVTPWTYRTREMCAFLRWLRSFNRDRPPSDRVAVYGLDVQATGAAAAAVARYLETVDSTYLASVLEGLRALEESGLYRAGPDAVGTANDLIADVADQFDRRRSAYVSETSQNAWTLARQHVRVLEQACANRLASLEEPTPDVPRRDAFMAQNVSWILDHEDRSSMAIWAHNGHVAKGGTAGHWSRTPLGSHLAEQYGDRYRAVAMEFDRGRFRAAEPASGDGPGGFRTFATNSLSGLRSAWLPPQVDAGDRDLPEWTLLEAIASDWTGDDRLGQRGEGTIPDGNAAFVDVAGASTDPSLAEWLGRPHLFHSIGAVFDPERRPRYARVVVPSAEFDALVVVERSTAVRPLDDPE